MTVRIMWEHLLEFFIHAIKDTLPTLPWIFLMYAVIQLLENKTTLNNATRLNGKLAPLFGSATGIIPQCGFSVMAAKFYEKKYITLGTLLAVFFATSDEAFIILLSSGAGAVWLLPTVALKIIAGVFVGYSVDFVLNKTGRGRVCLEMPENNPTTPKTTRDIFMKQYAEDNEVSVVCSCGRAHNGDSSTKKYLLYPLLHTLQVGLFIFLVNFVLTAIIHSVGEDSFSAFMARSKFIQPLITVAVGLIPNCASSVVLTETFLSGGIAFGSFVAGLCANAGMGFVVLLKNTREWKRNLAIVAFTYIVSVVIGLLCNLLPIVA